MAFAEKDPTPSPDVVNRFHSKSDVDSSPNAHHHTIGPRKNQAADGAHIHNGDGSLKLDPSTCFSKGILSGVTITGSRGGNTALASVIAALVTLGATDSTTA